MTFFCKDKSGRGYSCDLSWDETMKDFYSTDPEEQEESEFVDWIESAEVGSEYHLHNKSYTRIA
jgi:hypothetical protein